MSSARWFRWQPVACALPLVIVACANDPDASAEDTMVVDDTDTDTDTDTDGNQLSCEAPDPGAICAGMDEAAAIIVSSDEELEAAAAGLTCHPGRLEIKGTVTSLAPLSGLQEVQLLEIRFSMLEDLAGLDALHSVGELVVISNANLVDIGPLPALTRADAIDIRDNNEVVALSGLSQIVETRDFGLIGNDALADLSALSGLERTEDLEITRSPVLDMDALGLLQVVGGTMTIEAMPVLESISGIESLQLVCGNVDIRENTELLQCEVTNWFEEIDEVMGALVSGQNKPGGCMD